jgi:5-formyltetrahydrofolate cyclo-ligase
LIEKRELRTRLIEARRALPAETLEEASIRIEARITHLAELDRPGAVALFFPLSHEIDLRDLGRGLAGGRDVVYPRIERGTKILRFGRVRDEEELVLGPMGLKQPPASGDVELSSISVFIVPGLAYDRSGLRLGHGGGYYDTTLPLAPGALRIGVCLDEELVEKLPELPHDQRVDMVVTPHRVHRPTPGR